MGFMMANMTVVGIDPGGRHTGVVARRGDDCLYQAVIKRAGDDVMPDSQYLHEVLSAVAAAQQSCQHPPLVCVEGVVAPSPHLGISNPSGIIAAGLVLGAVLAMHPDALVVRPSRFGGAPLGDYPDKLRGPREVTGTGKMRHARSAWDVAAAGSQLSRLKNA